MNMFMNFKFSRRGQRETPVGDIYAIVVVGPVDNYFSAQAECARRAVKWATRPSNSSRGA